jgi:uncharacterized protein (DUF2384 family)
MEAATTRRANHVQNGIGAKFEVFEIYIIFVDHLNKKAKAMHFQEAQNAWFKVGDSIYERRAELEPAATIMDGRRDFKFTEVLWDDAIDIWTPTHTYTCTRNGIIKTEIPF